MFPSQNEKAITVFLVSFPIGILFGLLLQIGDGNAPVIIGTLGTLFSAFLGATVAFRLESKSRKEEERKVELEASNKILFQLMQKLNCMKVFQVDHIEPCRDDPGIMISMKPIPDFRPPSGELNAIDVPFLFSGKSKSVMLKINVLNEVFEETVKAIKMRADIHMNYYQRGLEAQGRDFGEALTEQDVRDILGPRNYTMLNQFTDIVVTYTDRFLSEGDDLRRELIALFKDRFSEDEVLSFELNQNIA